MPVKSISDLRAELDAKERQLGKLRSRRAVVARELDKIDRQIGVLEGKGGRVKAAPKRAKAVPKRARRAKQRATGKPLTAYITDALKSAKGGVSVTNVVEAVQKAGYKSYSKDFYAIVAKTLLTDDRFKRIKRGVYTLA